jgi:hypothetical protein
MMQMMEFVGFVLGSFVRGAGIGVFIVEMEREDVANWNCMELVWSDTLEHSTGV